jgi:hypothetical protein
MAEVKTLTPTPALYDFVLYFECASKDWVPGAKKTSISGDGSLLNLINWNSTYSYDPDDKGGKTLFGVTETTWQNFVQRYPNKGYSKDLNSMGKKGWLDQIDWFWYEKSNAGKCANYACAFLMFQMAWVGFSSSTQTKLLSTLKTNADIKDYNFITTGSNYTKIADATHAYKDPMMAYDFMRKSVAAYYYNISTPDKTNSKYRMGWLNRSALSFTPYGLYVPTTISGKSAGLQYSSSLDEWESTAIRLAQNNTNGYVKIVDWGTDPETIDNISNNPYNYDSAEKEYATKQPNSSSGSYGGCGNVSQLGNYTNAPTGKSEQQKQQIAAQKTKNRENVLNTLVKGSYSPNSVKKCTELLSSDKKKGIKTKSEN